MEVQGTYYFPESTKTCTSRIKIKKNNIKVFTSGGDLLLETNKNSVKQSLSIPGLPNSLEFFDGSSFIPSDKSIKWSSDAPLMRITERLMNNIKFVIIIILFCPLVFWFLIFKAIPNIAENTAELIPEASKGIISEKSLDYHKDDYFVKSEIDSKKRIKIETLFFETLNNLGLDKERYKLFFYKAEVIGANAFALPDGTIILTDGMVEKLISNPGSLLAILLHEVGHIENNHGVRLIIQSLGMGIIFTYLVGDIQGLTEMISGSGLGLLQASFSREMEIEADKFSMNCLKEIGIPKEKFIFAMETLALEQDETEHNNLFIKYLSTHPHIKKRIELAKRL